jgi:D-beta-D-heptose 7-phosphate kinase/D-beta-D-heptose 1-phosphate adenosyltransferase
METYPVSHRKIFPNPADLAPRIENLRAQGKTIVFGNGCFDLIHVGHIHYLTAAKALGDVLIIAVNTDASVRKIKPERPPINPENERMEVIAALEAVDYVVPLAETIPYALIELFKPHIQAKGTDYTLDEMPERHVVERHGGRIEFVGGPKNHSTTALKAAIQARGE